MSIEKVTNEVCDNGKIELGNSITCIEKNTDLEIIGKKKEYSIVGDSLYASITSEEAPQWLTAIIDNVVNSLIGTRLNNLNKAIDSINTSLMELEVAKNQYQELINIDSRIDSVLASRLQTLNATIQQNSANIIELDTTKVTPNEALAISIDHVNAQINNGKIHSLVTELNNTIANNDIAAADRIETLESVYDQNESKVRSILSNSAGAYTATANALTELEVNLNEDLYGATGLENTLKAEITNEGKRVESKFAYNSSIGINGKFYKSGFGLSALTTSGGTGTEANPYNSEFWIDASKFKFTNSNQTGQVAPFTIDASGTTPQITFNGIVNFANTNVANGLPGTTKINGGLIETNSITADRINTAGLIAEDISADTIYGKKIIGAIIEGAVIKASFLDLNQGLKLLTSYVIPASTYLANMSDYPDCVYESDTNTYRIPTLTRVNENTGSKVLSAGQSFEGALSPYNAAKEGNLLKARLIRPTFETTGSFNMVTASSTTSGFDSPSRINFSIKLGPTEIFRFQYSGTYENRPMWVHAFTAVSPYYGNSTITLQYSKPDYMTKANPMVYSTSADVLTPLVKVRINITYKLWWDIRGVGDGGTVYEVYQTQTIVTLDTLAFRNKIPFDWVSGHIAIVNNGSESITAALNSHLFIDNTQA